MAKTKAIEKNRQEIPSIEEMESYILAQGSDDLGIFGGTFVGGIHSQQIADELAPCVADILSTGEPIRTYLEIGAAAGGSSFLIHRFLKPETIVLVDDNRHGKCGLRSQVLAGIPHEEITANSASEEAIKALKEKGILFDLIMIDGDHSYAAAKLDVILYLPFLRPGGFLFLHDSVYAPGGVGRVVRELKEDKGVELFGEYISKKHPLPCGIALFRKAVDR